MASQKNKEFIKDVADKNVLVDKELVRKHEELEKELKNLGVDTKPKFRISHPLTSKHHLFYNH